MWLLSLVYLPFQQNALLLLDSLYVPAVSCESLVNCAVTSDLILWPGTQPVCQGRGDDHY